MRIEQQVGVSDEGRHGRADLVAHVGEERRLGLVGLLALLPSGLELDGLPLEQLGPHERVEEHRVGMRGLDPEEASVSSDDDGEPCDEPRRAGHEHQGSDTSDGAIRTTRCARSRPRLADTDAMAAALIPAMDMMTRNDSRSKPLRPRRVAPPKPHVADDSRSPDAEQPRPWGAGRDGHMAGNALAISEAPDPDEREPHRRDGARGGVRARDGRRRQDHGREHPVAVDARHRSLRKGLARGPQDVGALGGAEPRVCVVEGAGGTHLA